MGMDGGKGNNMGGGFGGKGDFGGGIWVLVCL